MRPRCLARRRMQGWGSRRRSDAGQGGPVGGRPAWGDGAIRLLPVDNANGILARFVPMSTDSVPVPAPQPVSVQLPSVYPSRIDLWLAIVVLLAVLSPLAVVTVRGAGSGAEQVVVWVTALLPLLAGGLLLLPCRYTLASDHLHIRCGVIRQRIAYRDITGIAPSRNILSAPALSLQRVKVSYRRGRGQGFQLVSPRERERFMQTLRQRVDGAAGHTAG